jgi:hypothetical protein
MPNEFIIKNGYRSQGNSEITGSLRVTGSLGATGSFSVSSSNGQLTETSARDANSVASINFGNRTLFDASANSSMDWDNRLLYDAAGGISVDWNGRALIDSIGNTALSYDAPNANQNLIAGFYLRKTIPQTVQEAFSDYGTVGDWNTDGEILDGVTLDASVAQFDLVFLDTDGIWYPVTQATTDCTKILGICLETGRTAVLIEGNILVTSNVGNSTNVPYIQSLNFGIPIYIKDSGGNAMSTVQPTGTGQYVRILGHAYYQNTNDTDYWIMKFRPSNDWYVI